MPLSLDMRKRVDLVALGLMAAGIAILMILLRGSFSPVVLFFHLVTSFGTAAIVGIPWLLVSGRSFRHYLVRIVMVTLLLALIMSALIRVASTMGDEGVGLVLIANFGVVFAILLVIGLVVVELGLRWRGRKSGSG